MLTSYWSFYYTTQENPETKIEVKKRICKIPDRTKTWKDLVTMKLPDATIKTVGYERI